ncbi:MAG: Fe/S biosis protein NfuA [Actinomycetota bacterium]|jgi:Fe/S biogenesis protein NfuA|nr:Fe/S biosis protein NfuA [Actinomycetota bacterium]
MSEAPVSQEGVPELVLTVTDVARQKVLRVRANENEPEKLALWLEIAGVANGKYKYDMYFQPIDYAGPSDVVQRHDDLSIVIPAFSIDKVRGATLDVAGDPTEGGLVLDNPNSPSPAVGAAGVARPPADLTGDVAQRVLQVLDAQINPSIAAHGGRAELVAVEENTAFLRLSGGCQGCGMASVTLSQGIEVVIKEQVPEITRVVDVTDHASGENPYFEAAKK